MVCVDATLEDSRKGKLNVMEGLPDVDAEIRLTLKRMTEQSRSM